MIPAWENEFHPFLSCVPRALAEDLFPGRPFLGSRVVAVIVGGLTLGLVFLVARGLGGALCAWLTVGLLGFNQIFLTLARYGMSNLDAVAAAAVWTLSVAGMWRSRRRSLAMLAGMVQGLGVYLYYSALALLPIGLGLLTVMAVARPRELLRRWGLIVFYCLGLALARTPEIVYQKLSHFSVRDHTWHVNTVMLLSRNNLEAAYQATGTSSVPALLKAYAWPALGGLLIWPHQGYPADYFYKGLPIVERGVAALFLAALVGAALLWRRRRLLLVLILWVVFGGMLPSLLTLNAPYAPRVVIALTAIHILAAWMVASLVIQVRRGLLGKPLAAGLLVLALAWTAAVSTQQARHYYGKFIQDRSLFWYSAMPWGLVEFLRTFPQDAHMVYYASGAYNQFHNSVVKMADRGFPRQTFTSAAALPPPTPEAPRTAYVFEMPNFAALSAQFQAQQPTARRIELLNPFAPELGATYHVYWVERAHGTQSAGGPVATDLAVNTQHP